MKSKIALYDLRTLRELHVSRTARDRYGFDESLFSFDGRAVFADFHQARLFAQKIADASVGEDRPGWPPSAGDINAMGFIDEVLHVIIARYRAEVAPRLLVDALERLESRLGHEAVDTVLTTFVNEFPPVAVYRGELTAEDYLSDDSQRQAALEEMLLLWLAHLNPAFAPYSELFDDSRLRSQTEYLACMAEIGSFLGSRPPLGGEANLLNLLRAPAAASPGSLAGQLDFIRSAWASWLGEALRRLLGSIDLLAEENKPFFGFGPGPVEVPVYGPPADDEGEPPQAYSSDLHWMPSLVLLAKNVFVWLDQLCKRYGRHIVTLDQVPDRELDLLAKWGVSGLWLIGVWERSRASKRIKQMMGDHDAVASAYSLLDYRIADDLGGEAAFDNLKWRAWQRGIRMSTDMVPNHVGIDSRWVIEHPDWFIGRDHSPFPGYTFNGPDLCDDGRVGVYLEDHYFDRSDAAVVFKRVDHWTGSERYIYHGNDGTSMPWNDTAQLDYTKAEVREAVIETILHVARISPVIRFDAAMTLAKKPYQRLWFPEPGSGGDIPSRAEEGLTRADFDALMPEEFWREVVDRVAEEAPDTLLLAEAFWLLEGYFVRTLGMHRVYNSAFMNMLRDEMNAEYRQLIKNTLEYDPQILKRYVNFMSNPDEETAVEQFGTDDKYFGVATLMVTLPGLPMFGHGQIEGFREKYGMEFRRPRWQEHPDGGLVLRHERQIFPLLHRRRLFAEVDNFLLYDLYLEDGSVDENVFAYSNRADGDSALVVYNNRHGETRGWLRMSAAVRAGHGEGDPVLVRRSVAEGLQVSDGQDCFLVLHDVVSELETLRPCRDIVDKGLFVEMGAYGLHVFLDPRQVVDDDQGRYARLNERLGGRPVASVARALRELEVAPLLEPFRAVVSAELLAKLLDACSAEPADGDEKQLLDALEEDFARLIVAAAEWTGADHDPAETAALVRREVAAVVETVRRFGVADDKTDEPAAVEVSPPHGLALLSWALCRGPGRAAAEGYFDDWLLGHALADAYVDLERTPREAEREVETVRLMVASEGLLLGCGADDLWAAELADLLSSAAGRRYLGVNRFGGVQWFNGESLEEMLEWKRLQTLVEAALDPERELEEARAAVDEAVETVRRAGQRSEYSFDKLIEALEPGAGDHDRE